MCLCIWVDGPVRQEHWLPMKSVSAAVYCLPEAMKATTNSKGIPIKAKKEDRNDRN